MNYQKQIIHYYKKMKEDGLTNGTSGNISLYDKESGKIFITPTGITPETLCDGDISIVDMNGNHLEGKKASSELEMHTIFYKNRKEISAVLHAHTKYATAIACMRMNLPAIDYMIAVSNDIEVRCAPYASYGTTNLAKNSYETMGKGKAVLLANHGITTVGESIEEAYHILSQIEYVAELYLTSSILGNPIILEKDEMEKLVLKFKNYGQK